MSFPFQLQLRAQHAKARVPGAYGPLWLHALCTAGVIALMAVSWVLSGYELSQHALAGCLLTATATLIYWGWLRLAAPTRAYALRVTASGHAYVQITPAHDQDSPVFYPFEPRLTQRWHQWCMAQGIAHTPFGLKRVRIELEGGLLAHLLGLVPADQLRKLQLWVGWAQAHPQRLGLHSTVTSMPGAV